jgi:hypothetical protein
MGRSTPLKPMRASILHLSSNELFIPVQTEAITLCFRRVRARVAGGACAAIAGMDIKGVAATGAAAMLNKNSLRFMVQTIPAAGAVFRRKMILDYEALPNGKGTERRVFPPVNVTRFYTRL